MVTFLPNVPLPIQPPVGRRKGTLIQLLRRSLNRRHQPCRYCHLAKWGRCRFGVSLSLYTVECSSVEAELERKERNDVTLSVSTLRGTIDSEMLSLSVVATGDQFPSVFSVSFFGMDSLCTTGGWGSSWERRDFSRYVLCGIFDEGDAAMSAKCRFSRCSPLVPVSCNRRFLVWSSDLTTDADHREFFCRGKAVAKRKKRQDSLFFMLHSTVN